MARSISRASELCLSFRKRTAPLAPDYLAKGLSICRDLNLDRKYGYNLQAIGTAAK